MAQAGQFCSTWFCSGNHHCIARTKTRNPAAPATPSAVERQRQAAAATDMSTGRHHTQWCDQEMGEMSRPSTMTTLI